MTLAIHKSLSKFFLKINNDIKTVKKLLYYLVLLFLEHQTKIIAIDAMEPLE
jgi:hypothetical protein